MEMLLGGLGLGIVGLYTGWKLWNSQHNLKMSHSDAIERNYDVLLRCTTINLYVIDFLKAEDVLVRMQEDELRTQRNPLKQCTLLFKWLKEVSSERYESFLQVMKDTEQEHVANLLQGNTEEDHSPLSEIRYRRLDKIRPKIANVIYIDNEVIAELRSSKAISKTDAEEIRAENVDYAKISKLLSAIMRRSNHCYKSFRQVLRKTLQWAAAGFLSEGEMPAVHVNNKRPDLDEPLSHAFNQLTRSRTTDDAEINHLFAEMNGLGLNPVRAIPGQSIVIFIYCKTVQNAANFATLFTNGRLQYILESIFNQLLLTIEPRNTEKLDSRLSLEDEEIVTLEKFTGTEGWVREGLSWLLPLGKRDECDATTKTDEEALSEIDFETIPTFVKTIRTKAAKRDSKAIFGLAVLNQELFIISEHSSDVEVYDSESLTFKHQFDLEGLYDPIDMKSCSRNNCLYILDWKEEESSEIIKVGSNGKLITKWKPGDGGGYISVTPEANVILSYWKTSLLKEFTAEGEFLREIQLPSSIRELRLAIKLPNGDFLISQGEEESEHRVCLVDDKGIVLKSIGEKQGSSNGEFHNPNYLVVDGSGFILVADQNNKRVVLLSPNLEFQKEVIQEKDDLRYPVRMDLNRTSGRLFVADNDYLENHGGWRDGRIKAFDFNIRLSPHMI